MNEDTIRNLLEEAGDPSGLYSAAVTAKGISCFLPIRLQLINNVIWYLKDCKQEANYG